MPLDPAHPAQALRPPDPSPEAELAGFAATLTWEQVPDPIRHEARRSLVNFFATALAGARDRTLDLAAQTLLPFAAPGPCTVIGRGLTTDPLRASSLNAMSGNVFDFDDTHGPTILHPTAPVAPAAFALAQAGLPQTTRPHPTPTSGRALLTAFIAGVEVECRIANALSPWHYRRGWHITSTCGIFGAAAAAGRLLGLDAASMVAAFGHASAQSSGLVETLGTMSKSIGVGNAPANGIVSALLAQRGFDGPEAPLTGRLGLLKVVGEDADPQALVRGLGDDWALAQNTYKPYPCGVVLNPVIEACLALFHDDGIRWPDVAGIALTGHPLLRDRTDRPWPRTGRESQVNARHAVAAVLTTGVADLDTFNDAAVLAIGRAVGRTVDAGREVAFTFHDDPALDIEAATVQVTRADGSVRSRHVASARGGRRTPLTDDALSRKLRDLARWGRSGCAVEPLLDALWRLDELDDAGAVIRLAAGATIDPS